MGGTARDRPPRPLPNRRIARGGPEPAPGCYIRPRSRQSRSRRYNARRFADFCAEAFVFANRRINSRTSFGVRSENMSAIQLSCSAAILRNSARPIFVSRITCAGRHQTFAVGVTGLDEALRQPGDVAVRHHHPLKHRTASCLPAPCRAGPSGRPRQRDIEPLTQPAAHPPRSGSCRSRGGATIEAHCRDLPGVRRPWSRIKDHDAIIPACRLHAPPRHRRSRVYGFPPVILTFK